MKKMKSLQGAFYVLVLLSVIVALFYWYTMQNSRRMEERNRNYAAD